MGGMPRATEEKSRRRNIAILVALSSTLAVLAFGAWMSEVFNPLLLAALLAYICNPVVGRFQPVFKNRLVTIVFIYVAALALFFALPLLFLPTLSYEISTFGYAMVGEPGTDLDGNDRPDPGEVYTDLNHDGQATRDELFRDVNRNGRWDHGYFDQLITDLKGRIDGIDTPTKAWFRRNVDLERVWDYLRSNVRNIAQTGTLAGGWMVKKFFSGIQSATTLFSYLILVPIYTFFLLWNSQAILDTTRHYLPGRYRLRILSIVGKIDVAVSSFFRGRFLICIMKGIITSIGLWLCGVKFALVIGLAAGFLSVVPFLGVVLSAIPAITLVLIDFQGSLSRALAVVLVFAFVEALEGLVLTPWILGKETGLHPITLILSLLIAGKLLGFFGLLMAIPLVAIAKILAREFLLPHLEELAAEEPEES